MNYAELSKTIGDIRRGDVAYWQTVQRASNAIITMLSEFGVPGNMVVAGLAEMQANGVFARLLTLKTAEKKGSGFLSGTENHEVKLIFKVSLDTDELLHIYVNDYECGTAHNAEEATELLMQGFIFADQSRSTIETGQLHLIWQGFANG